MCVDGAVTDIGIGPESLWTCYMGSLAGRAGRTPRPTSPRRLYRALRAATDAPSGAHIGAIIAPKAHLHPGVSPPTTVPDSWSVQGLTAVTLFGAMDRVRAHIGIGPESLWTWYMGSLAGRADRTPRVPVGPG